MHGRERAAVHVEPGDRLEHRLVGDVHGHDDVVVRQGGEHPLQVGHPAGREQDRPRPVPGGQRAAEHGRALGDVEALGRLEARAQRDVGQRDVVGEAFVVGRRDGLEVRAGHAGHPPRTTASASGHHGPPDRTTADRRGHRADDRDHGDQQERLVRAELVGQRAERERRDTDRQTGGQGRARLRRVRSVRRGGQQQRDGQRVLERRSPSPETTSPSIATAGVVAVHRIAQPPIARTNAPVSRIAGRDAQGQRPGDEADHRHAEHEARGRRGSDARAGVGLLDDEARGPVGGGELHGDRRDERRQEAPGGQGAAADGCREAVTGAGCGLRRARASWRRRPGSARA